MLQQPVEEGDLLVRLRELCEGLLALVDHQHRVGPDPQRRFQLVQGMRARCHDLHPRPVALQSRGDAGAHQGGLAAARRTDDRQHAHFPQPVETGQQVALPTEEHVGVLHLVGEEPRVGTRRGRRRQRLLDESGILRQDRPLELDELRAGVHPELPRQHRPHLAQGPERLRLATGLVLRPSQQGPASFAHGVGPDRRPQVGQDPRVLTRPKRGVQAELLGVQSQGGQAFRLDPPTVPLDQVAQRFPAPQVERLVQEVRGAVRLPQLQELPGTLDEALEAPGVELLVSRS